MNKTVLMISYLSWWLIWASAESYLIVQLGYSWPMAASDVLISNGVLMLSGYVIANIFRFYQPDLNNILYLLVLSLLMGPACFWISKEMLVFTITDSAYLQFINETYWLRMLISWLLVSFMIIVGWLWFYIKERQAVANREAETAQLAREAELMRLREQLQPHFLFNSLNSINALVGSQPQQARTMIRQLSDFLRGTLNRDTQKWTSLHEELQQLELYLSIEKVRFGDRLVVEVRHDEASNIAKLPPLLLQPLLENAIKFGLYDTLESVHIAIDCKLEMQKLSIEISNPYDPSTAEAGKGEGFGLKSVQRRLHLLFGRQDLLSTQSNNGTFTVTLSIPQA